MSIDDSEAPESTLAVVLGVLGLLTGLASCPASLLPICGCPVSLVGVILSGVAVSTGRGAGRALGVGGLALSALSLLITLVNAVWGAYQGATGQHELINMF